MTNTFINRLILIVVLITIFACKKDSDKTTPGPEPTQNHPDLSGYTSTDVSNNYTGVFDTTDWRYYEVWSQVEKNLFGTGSFNSNCFFNDSILDAGAYPNPVDNLTIGHSFHLFIGPIDFSTGQFVDSTTTIEAVLVNQRFEKLTNVIHLNNPEILISLDSLDNNPTDTIFRIYIKFTDSNGCVRCGHGDIMRYS